MLVRRLPDRTYSTAHTVCIFGPINRATPLPIYPYTPHVLYVFYTYCSTPYILRSSRRTRIASLSSSMHQRIEKRNPSIHQSVSIATNVDQYAQWFRTGGIMNNEKKRLMPKPPSCKIHYPQSRDHPKSNAWKSTQNSHQGTKTYILPRSQE